MSDSRITVSTPTVTRAEQNRHNASHSTGPRTIAGKTISKLNAVKNGLTGRTVLLPSDDAARYEQHVQNWITELNPEGPRECALVQSIADAYWRAERIVRIEFALYAEGAGSAGEADAKGNNEPDELATYLRHERQLRNLSVQEGRLRRSREKDLQELRELQKEREERSQDTNTATAAKKVNTALVAPVPSQEEGSRTTATNESQTVGFVFATPTSPLSAMKESVVAQGK